MFSLEKEVVMKISTALASTYYQEWIDTYSEIFRFSRAQDYRNNPDKLLSIQLTLAELETRIWEKLREGKNRLSKFRGKDKLSAVEIKEKEGLELHIQIHKLLLNISRTICDGIVWRNLDYDRMFLESSSRGFSTGAVDVNKPDTQSEFQWAKRIVDTFGGIVILNDLTRFLRISDLTQIDKDAIFIHEIKKLGKVVKNMFTLREEAKGNNYKLSGQSKRLLELQRTALLREIDTPSGKVKPRFIDIKIRTHADKVAILMQRSENEFFVISQLEPFLIVEVTNFRAIKNLSSEEINHHINQGSKRVDNNGHITLIHSSWDAFYYDEQGNFFRSVSPYSIFPMKNKLCMDLMSGYIKVQSEIDLTELQNILRQHDWQVQQISEEELDKRQKEIEVVKDKIYTGKIFEHPFNVPLLTIKRGPFNMGIGSDLIVRMTMEFMTFETFLAILEENYRRAAKIQKTDIFYPVFRERDLWN